MSGVGHVVQGRAAERGALLRVQTLGTIDALTAVQWADLFPGHPDVFENIALTQRCGMDGFTFRTVVVGDGEGPVLVIPTFEARFDAAGMADGAAAGLIRLMGRILPGVFRPRLLGIGLVECEWGAMGVRCGLSPAAAERAWALGMGAVRELAARVRADATVMLDLSPAALEGVPASERRRFAPVGTSPVAQLPLAFGTVDEYLAGLSRSTRQGLRRKLRRSGVRVERVDHAGDYLDRITALYRQTVARSPVVLGVQRASYFASACERVPGAHYVLYFRGDELLAFNLLIARDRVLIDKYFGMDPQAGREHSLYFVSWMENVRHAIENGFALYHAGQGAEGTKRSLGCRFVRTQTLFRHANPAAHAVLSLLARTVARDTSVEDGRALRPAGVVG